MPDYNVDGVASSWQLPTLDEELEWSNTLEQRATWIDIRMYKPTSSMEVVYILRRVEEAKAARLAEMVKAVKARKSKAKAGDGSSSKCGSEAHARRELWGKILPKIILPG